MARILVGTASWSDPGFIEDWYPPGLPKNRLLSWYAEHFSFVEVNATFYSIPVERVVEGWVRQTPKDFVFDMKLFKLLSRHSVEAKFLPPDLRKQARFAGGKVVLSPELEDSVAERILREIEPLRAAGKLGIETKGLAGAVAIGGRVAEPRLECASAIDFVARFGQSGNEP